MSNYKLNYAYSPPHVKYWGELEIDLPDILQQQITAQYETIKKTLHIRVEEVKFEDAFDMQTEIFRDEYLNNIRYFVIGPKGANFLRNPKFKITYKEFAAKVNIETIISLWRNLIDNPTTGNIALFPATYVGQAVLREFQPNDGHPENEGIGTIYRSWQVKNLVPTLIEYAGYSSDWEYDSTKKDTVKEIKVTFQAQEMVQQ